MPDAPAGARTSAAPLLLFAAALAASTAAQWALRSGPAASAELALAAGALLLAAAAGRALGSPGPAPGARATASAASALLRSPAVARGLRPALAPWQALAPARPALAAVGTASLAAALALQGLERAPALSLAAWVASVLAWNAAYAGPRAGAADATARRDAALAAALFAVALAARAVDLGGTPGGLYGDEAAFGMRARALLAGERIAPFGLGLEQIPALWTWLQAGTMTLFGDGVVGVRAVSALTGSLAVPALYAFLRRELGAVPAAGGALGLALAPWNVHVGRLGLNEAWVVLCSVSSLGALLAALRSERGAPWVRAGTWIGLCFYAGNKAVLLPPILLGAGTAAWLALRRAGPTAAPPRLPWRPALLLAASAVLAFAPQALHLAGGPWHGVLVSHPTRWLALPEGAAGWAAQLALLARALLDHADTSVFAGWPGMRIVGAGEATLFVVGLGVALARPGRPLAALLLGWLAAGLASLVVDREPTQLHHLILLAAAPAAFGALALDAAAALVARAARRPALGAVAALALAAAVAAQGAHAYFVEGARRWNYAETAALGRAMGELAPTHHLVLVTPPMSWDLNSNLLFLARGVHARDKRVALDPARSWLEPPGRDVAFLVDGRSASLVPRIRARYPEASIEEWRGPSARLRLAVVRVPAAAIERAEGALLRAGR